LQLERWKSILEERLEQARQSGLNAEFIKRVLEEIHKEAIKIQSRNK
jgi:chorismate mutase